VLQQWKLADLREMGQGCLPPNLSSTMMTILPEKYALQVNTFIFGLKHSSGLYLNVFKNTVMHAFVKGTDWALSPFFLPWY
jgi:hypothetical protein